MKKRLVFILIGLSGMTLLSGCLGLSVQFGGGKKNSMSTNNTSNNNTTSNDPHPTVVQQTVAPTIGDQLLDLKKARDAGVISEQEYQTEKAKILAQKQ